MHGRIWQSFAVLMLLGLALTACSRKQEVAPAAHLTGETSKAGAQLAYEHRLSLQLPPQVIAPRLADARKACETARFGECNVLRIEQSSQGASITLRIVPAGIEPLVALTAQGGKVGERQTTAEDLAPAMADNQRRQARLKLQQQRLDELAARKDVSVSDLIALSREQATVETELQALEQAASMQQHRIATNLLTLELRPAGIETHGYRLRTSLGSILDQFIDGAANALELLGYGLPFLILGFPLLWLWVRLWRRFMRRSA